MKLIKLSGKNIKGQTFTEDVSDLTLYVGRNYRGKSSRLIARTLLLLGYIPKLGNTPGGTFKLSSGSVMSVSGTFDTGETITRTWTLKGNSVSYQKEVPERLKDVEGLAVMMDAGEYFGLSAQKRVDYVFGLVNVTGVWTRGGIMDRIANKVPSFDISEPNQKTLAQKLICDSQEQFGEEHDNVQDIVGRALLFVADEWKAAGASVKRCEATIQKLTQDRAADTFTQGLPLAVLEAQKKETDAEIAALNEEKGALIASFTKMVSDRQRREAIDREVRFADKNRQSLVDANEKLRLVVERRELVPVYDRTHITAANDRSNAVKAKIAEVSAKIDTARRAVNRAESTLQGMDAATVCPYCGASGDGWKAIKLAELAQEVDALDTEKANNQILIEALAKDIEVARTEYNEIEAAIASRNELIGTAHDLRQHIAELNGSLTRVTTLTEERTRLTPDDPELDAKVQGLQSNLNVKNEALRGIEAGIKAHQGRELERQRMANAEAERDAAVKEKETAKEVGTELKAIQGEIVAAAFAPLLESANRFFSDILPEELKYNSDTQEIGMYRNGIWVSPDTFSGTEEALGFVAIQLALASASPCRLMIIDELRRLDDANQMAALARLESCVLRGEVDQVVTALPASNKEDFAPGRFAPFKSVVIS